MRIARRLILKLYLAWQNTDTLTKNIPPEKELFDADFYLEQYPDVSTSGIDPYEHFVIYGKKEGRICTSPQPSKADYWGALKDLDPTRQTALVVTHDASRTGAPILSLNIVRELKKKYNVITLLLVDSGAIADDFHNLSDIVMGPVMDGRNPSLVAPLIDQLLALTTVSFSIVNSIESRAVLPALARHFIPTVTLIHEFASHTRPREAFRETIFWSTETIFSTPVTHENAIFEYPDLNNCRFHIIPQGRCALPSVESEMTSRLNEDVKVLAALRPVGLPQDTVIVLGAGTVELRKGVDLFIACAAEVMKLSPDEHFRFVWIGSGYDPEYDSAYSVYLADQICRSGLQQHVSFLEATPSIEAAYQTADIFLLSPRLDPLPNVAIDAMTHGLPVVCFEQATGVADILITNGFGEVCVAPYFETSKLASKVLALIQSKALRQKTGKELQQLALSQFNMEDYVKRLEELTVDTGKRITQEQADILEIINSGLPRSDFFEGQQLDEAVRYYVRSWASGVWRRKLFPGFQPGIFLEQSGMQQTKGDSLANYLRAGQPDGPWRYDIITAEEIARPVSAATRIALHLHVYYPDLFPEILSRLSGNNIRPDLFISVPTQLIHDEMVNLLYDYSGKIMKIQIVPNCGRDIGPFLTAFGNIFLDHYDVVGHFHTKKSIEFRDELIGRSWYRFLLENLLGGKKNMADIILGNMSTDPSIGMVFPDDSYVIGWESNRTYAEALGKQLGLDTLTENLVFPVGTMFWARVHALRPLFNLGLTWQDYPAEPLPYDGTILHAIERLLPFIAAKQSTRSVLTNVAGITR